jgi:hypothetical protein
MMSRKLMITTVLAMVMVMALGMAVYAHGPGPMNGQSGAAGDGATMQAYQGGAQQMQHLRDGSNGDDSNGEGVCDDFVDEDDDGVCDNALMDGTGQGAGTMTRQGVRASQGMQANRAAAGMGQGLGQNLGTDFVDADDDGTCDNFLDEDGDGISDSAAQDGTGSQFGRQGKQGKQGQGRNR